MALTTPLIEPTARRLASIGGSQVPQLIFQYTRESGEKVLRPCQVDLIEYMTDILESMEIGARPIGWVFESVNGFEHVPITPGDEQEIALLAEYDRMFHENSGNSHEAGENSEE